MSDDYDALRLRLTEAARRGASQFASEYTASFSEISNLYVSKPGAASEVMGSGVDDMSVAVKTALLYNEMISLDVTVNSANLAMTWLTAEGLERQGAPEAIAVEVPSSHAPMVQSAVDRGGVGFGFIMPSGPEVEQFLSDLAPLIAQGRLIPRPTRALFIATEERTPEGGVHWNVLNAAPGTRLESWHVTAERRALGESTVTENALSLNRVQNAASKCIAQEIVVPYLSGVDLGDYATILEDEGDLLVEFRAAMKGLIAEYENGSRDLDEFKLDVIDPRISKIERSFKRITSMYRLRTGGASLATVALTLISYSTAGVAAAIGAVAGAAGFMTSIKEVADRNEKLASLKDDPLHLLWRLKRGKP